MQSAVYGQTSGEIRALQGPCSSARGDPVHPSPCPPDLGAPAVADYSGKGRARVWTLTAESTPEKQSSVILQ